jgi:hypothetical protein
LDIDISNACNVMSLATIKQRFLSFTWCMLKNIARLSFTMWMALESKYHDDNKGGGNSIRLNSTKQTAKALVITKLK